MSGVMVQACMCLPQLGLDLGRVCSVLYNWGEPHTGSIEIFLIIYICVHISAVHHSVYTCLLFQRSANLSSSCACIIRYAT